MLAEVTQCAQVKLTGKHMEASLLCDSLPSLTTAKRRCKRLYLLCLAPCPPRFNSNSMSSRKPVLSLTNWTLILALQFFRIFSSHHQLVCARFLSSKLVIWWPQQWCTKIFNTEILIGIKKQLLLLLSIIIVFDVLPRNPNYDPLLTVVISLWLNC